MVFDTVSKRSAFLPRRPPILRRSASWTGKGLLITGPSSSGKSSLLDTLTHSHTRTLTHSHTHTRGAPTHPRIGSFEDKFSKIAGTATPKKATPAKPAIIDDSEPTLEDKQIFARGLFRIGKEELGKVVTVLDDKSPEALTKNSAEDEVEINVDAIVPRVFHELSHYVESLVGGSATAGKKKA